MQLFPNFKMGSVSWKKGGQVGALIWWTALDALFRVVALAPNFDTNINFQRFSHGAGSIN